MAQTLMATTQATLVDLNDSFISDSNITQAQRSIVKADITNIIGFVPFDNNFGVTNFANKTAGSTTANQNIAYYSGSSSLQTPTGTWTENTTAYYSNIAIQDNTIFTVSTGSSSVGIAQTLYKFDLINYMASTYGYTPTVAWLENNIKELKFNWFGYGLSINGNKAYVDAWNTTSNAKWGSPVNTSSGTIASLGWDSTVNQTNIQNLIDSNGFVYFIAYSDQAGIIPVPAALATAALTTPTNAGSTLAAGTYYVTYTWITANGETTAPTSTAVTVAAGHNLVVSLPAFPFGVTQAKIYIGTTQGNETYQGNTISTTYTQSTLMASGAAKPTSNTAVVTARINTDYVELDVTLHPIPTTTGLDSIGTGSFAATRKAAVNAGILATDTNYTNLASQYTNLKSYLEGLTPVFPWDVAATDVITVDPPTWRNNWNNYYLAEQQLQQYTTQVLQGNINGVQPSGRNLLLNTALFTDPANPYWTLNAGSAIAGVLNVPYSDPVYGGVLWATLTANSATGNNWFVLENNSLTLPNGKFVVGQKYTISFLIKNAFAVIFNMMDSSGTNPVTTNYSVPANANWTEVTYTFTATATGNTPLFYLGKNDGTATGDLYLTQLKLETGNRATGWSAAPEEIGNTLADLQTRMTKVEQNTTSDSITTMVVSSEQLGTVLNGKANASDLANLATQDQLTQAQNDANSYTDGKVGDIDFTPFATFSYVDQKSDSITEQFGTFGGANIIHNSAGYSSTDFWSVTGTVATTQSADLAPYGSESGFVLTNGTMTQTITVQPNMEYTISAFVQKATSGTGYIQVDDGIQSPPPIYNLTDGTEYDFKQVSVTISPAGTSITLTLNGVAAGGVVITSLMGNIGANALQWSNHPQEMYNTYVQADINGLRVIHMDGEVVTGMTVMTPSAFAGYMDTNGDGVIDQSKGSADEVFRMDPDAFVMKSAVIKPIKMIPVTSGGHNGIAWVPYNS